MLVLAIETSGPRGTVALVDGDRLLDQIELAEPRRRHAQTLVPALLRILENHDRRPADCDGFAVSIGPGSFTGLRVGVVAAKTLAWATDRPLAAVDTLQAVALAAPPDVTRLHVIRNAQRQELFVGTCQRTPDDEIPRRIGDVRIEPAQAWCAARQPGEVVTGPAVEHWQTAFPPHCRLLPRQFHEPAAASVARLGIRQLEAGDHADPFALEPSYLRRSAAEENRAPS